MRSLCPRPVVLEHELLRGVVPEIDAGNAGRNLARVTGPEMRPRPDGGPAHGADRLASGTVFRASAVSGHWFFPVVHPHGTPQLHPA